MQIISFLNPREPRHSDLSLLAIRCVRALVNARTPVYWQVLAEPGPAPAFTSTMAPKPLAPGTLAQISQHDTAFSDLGDLFHVTRGHAQSGVTLAMAPPQWWPMLLGPMQGRHIGYLEQSPYMQVPEMAPYCDYLDEIWMPDPSLMQQLNQQCPNLATQFVAPVRRPAVQRDMPTSRLPAFREMLGVGERTYVFYAMLDAHAAESCVDFLKAYSQAFDGETKADVALVIQCPPELIDSHRDCAPMSAAQFFEGLLARLPSSRTHGSPRVVLLDQNLNSAGMDLLHACGNAMLVPRCGDALGLRAIDAAEAGNEVVGSTGKNLELLLGPAWQALAVPSSSSGWVEELTQAMKNAWERRHDRGPLPGMIQWHLSNALSEAAFVQRVRHLLGGSLE